jgi:hypothetical protein
MPYKHRKKVKFICGFIYSKENIYRKVKTIMERKLGNIDFESEIIDFTFTDYYYTEIGKPLFRRFVAFKELRVAEELVKIKLFCINLERRFSLKEKRTINIDPGYLNDAKLILSTTKDFYHRIYLSRGIYAEVTLYYKKGNFCDFPTTYPDYRTYQYKSIFFSIRKIYHQQIKKYGLS